MMQIPLNDGGVFAVIEPGNIERLKAGKPLKVGNVMIAFTPDMQEFMGLLGASGELPAKGEKPKEFVGRWTPEQIQSALSTTQKLPEVMR
jgi:hypothetical protein